MSDAIPADQTSDPIPLVPADQISDPHKPAVSRSNDSKPGGYCDHCPPDGSPCPICDDCLDR
jgi:hypothetical protein